MPPQISENLSRIASSSTQLNQLSKQATEQIRSLDQFLDKLDVGIEHWHPNIIADGRERNCRDHLADAFYSLGYGRDDQGKFGIIIKAEAQSTDEDGFPLADVGYSGEKEPIFETIWTRPLSGASRPVRIAAMKALSDFIAGLADAIDKTITDLQKNMGEAQAAADELKAALSKPNLDAQISAARAAAEMDPPEHGSARTLAELLEAKARIIDPSLHQPVTRITKKK